MHFSIEGNVGSKKSTICSLLKSLGVIDIVFEEIVSDKFNNYIKNLGDKNTVIEYQHFVQKLKRDIFKEDSNQLFDRYIDGDMCFVDFFINDKLFTMKEFEKIKYKKCDLTFYLKSDPEKCLKRIIKRKRKGECVYNLEYINKLSKILDGKFLNESKNIIVFDVEYFTNSEIVKKITNIIKAKLICKN